MFKKASKSAIKVRLALSGVSGSGKTYSALAIATHLGKSIALIDTERGSSSRYADKFNFDVCELADFHPAQYIKAIQYAQEEYDVIIVDSLSHAWFAELDMAGGNFNNWAKIRPLERKLIDAIVGCKSHIIATMRSKNDWSMEDNDKGKKVAKKIGTASVQTAGIEYEFDIAGELDYNHILTVSKSRCEELTDKTFLNPGKNLADILKNWASDAPVMPAPVMPAPVMPAPVPQQSKSLTEISDEYLKKLGWTPKQGAEFLLGKYGVKSRSLLNDEQYLEFTDYLQIQVENLQDEKTESSEKIIQQEYDQKLEESTVEESDFLMDSDAIPY